MDSSLSKIETPEDQELRQKQGELAQATAELAELELELATLQAEITAFEGRYSQLVGKQYAELDDLEAKIAEIIARQHPDDPPSQRAAAAARSKATESAEAVGDVVNESQVKSSFRPSDELKQLFREVAKAVHPDLANGDKDRRRRERVMAEANIAYENGDEDRLRQLLNDWKSSPETVQGEGVGADLIRIIRTIALVRKRMAAIEADLDAQRRCDMHVLMVKVEDARDDGRDLLGDISAQLDIDIKNARGRLSKIDSGHD